MSTHSIRSARLLVAAVASSVVAAGLALLASVQPASAASYTTFDRSSWAYIDSRTPRESHLNPTGDAPVGALRDARGNDHKYRSFFTFDISRLLGTNVSSVTLFGAETQAADCVHRKVELWQTGPVDARTTWKNPPTEQQKLYTAGYIAGSGCPAVRVEWDATAAVQQAVGAGQSWVTLELRVPQANEGDTRLGRRFNNDLRMTVVYNTPPGVPTNLNVDNLGCSTQQPYVWEGLLGGDTSMLSAAVSDPDEGQSVSAEFAIWPVDHPDQRTTLPVITGLSSGAVVRERVPVGLVVDGTAYGFQARGVDADNAYSAWSTPCYFQTDYTRPASPPLVSSTDYPSDGVVHGGQGIDGTFTLSANGVSDVVGFVYDFNGSRPTGYVPADHLGGSATVTVAPPQGGIDIMDVSSVDRAGNRSDSTRYEFLTRQTTPELSYTGTPHSGRPFTLTFSPAYDLPPGYGTVVSYTYTVNSGPAQTVTANADGTATVDITFTGPYSSILDVSSVSSNGWTSPAYERSFYPDTSPSISSATYPEGGSGGAVGQAGTFTFESNFPDSTQFVYSFDGGGTWQTVDAGADGTASVTWSPDTPGDNMLIVYSQTADGTQSDWYFYMFTVNG